MQFEVKIDDAHLKRILKIVSAEIQQPAKMLGAIGAELAYKTEENFRNEAGPLGKWTLLSPLTIKSREKKGNFSKKILTDSGDLGRSIISGVSGDTVTVSAGSGASQKYAAIHQFGGKAGRGKKVEIKARPYLPIIGTPENSKLTENALTAILGVVEDHLTHVINRAKK